MAPARHWSKVLVHTDVTDVCLAYVLVAVLSHVGAIQICTKSSSAANLIFVIQVEVNAGRKEFALIGVR